MFFQYADHNQISKWIEKVLVEENTDLFESAFVDKYYNLQPATIPNKAEWDQAIKGILKDVVICSNDFTAGLVKSRGHKIIKVNPNIANKLNELGAKAPADVLNFHELEGRLVSDANANLRKIRDKVWNILESLDTTLGKNKPDIKCFTQNTLSEGADAGYYKDDCIYVKVDYKDDPGLNTYNIILEECAHHCTGALDCTRDFQEYAFKVAAMLMIKK
jgi:hypothetical protein